MSKCILTFDPVPMLSVDDETFYGINIIQKLHDLSREGSIQAMDLLKVASTQWVNPNISTIGFRLESELAVMPTKRMTDVGYDLTIVGVVKQLTPMTTMYDTDVSLAIPLGFYAEIAPRSSLSKTGYMLANSIGVIDPGYTGTIKVALVKIDQSMPNLELPVRVAQLILQPYVTSFSQDVTKTERLTTSRSDGGFGSTN